MAKSKKNTKQTKDSNVVPFDSIFANQRRAFLDEKSFDNFLALLGAAVGRPNTVEDITGLWETHRGVIPWGPSRCDEWAMFLSHYLVVPFVSEEHSDDVPEESLEVATTTPTATPGAPSPGEHAEEMEPLVKNFVDAFLRIEDLRQTGKYGDFVEANAFETLLAEVFGQDDPAQAIASYLKALFPDKPWIEPDDEVEEPTRRLELEWTPLCSRISIWSSLGEEISAHELEANAENIALKAENAPRKEFRVAASLCFVHLTHTCRKSDLFSTPIFRDVLPFMPQGLVVSLIRSHLEFGDKPNRLDGLLRLFRLGLGRTSPARRANCAYVPWRFVIPLLSHYQDVLLYYDERKWRHAGQIIQSIANRLAIDFEQHVRSVSYGVAPLPFQDMHFAEHLWLSGGDNQRPFHYFCCAFNGIENVWAGGQKQLEELFTATNNEGHAEFATAIASYFLFNQAITNNGRVGDWKQLSSIVDTALGMHGAERIHKALAFAAAVAENAGEHLQALELRSRIGTNDVTPPPASAVQQVLDNKATRDSAEKRLIADLGEARWLRLDHKAKRLLTDAEVHWSRDAGELGKDTFSDWGQVATAYGRAIEAHLLAKFRPIWNSPEMAEYRPAIASKREHPTSGPVLHTLKNFSVLHSSLQCLIEREGIGLHSDRELIGQLLGILETRNKGAHPGDVSERDALDLRTTLFKKRILARLIDCFA